MSLQYNYSQLVALLPQWTDDFSTEFAGQIDTIIGLAELRVIRDLNLTNFDATTTGTIASGAKTITFPSGLVDVISIEYFSPSQARWINVDRRSPDWVNDYSSAPVGPPAYFCEGGLVRESIADTWVVAPTTDQAYSYRVFYIIRPKQLSSNFPTSWLSQNVADLFFYACLVCCEQFLKADERIPVWKTQYEEVLLPAAKKELRKLMRSEYP